MTTGGSTRPVHTVPETGVSGAAIESLEVDVLVVPCFEGDDLADQPALASLVADEHVRARQPGLFGSKPFETLAVPTRAGWGCRQVILVGSGDPSGWSVDRAWRVAATGGLAARGLGFTRLGLVERNPGSVSDARLVQALTEGAVIANFDPGAHKTSGPPPCWLERVVVRTANGEVAQAVEWGRVLGRAVNLSRELANAPSNTLTPRGLAARAEAVAADTGLGVEVLDERAMADLGMGMLLGVARGSEEPPRLIVLRHEPDGAPEGPVLGLIGKGVTFDTGGISLKVAEKMERMKDDMAGGAAVIAAMGAIATLGLPVHCVGVVPATENMPGGDAVKPGDVLISAQGTTVEVINTDAEGRLILGDALWYARRCGATHLVDAATLTGSCIVALGYTTTGLFGVPDAWTAHVRDAATRAGERAWPMPTFEDDRDLLKSEIADMVNSAGRDAGAISAAWFIGAFAGDRPWAHLDIAGTAWAEKPAPYQPPGATGAGVRTLVELAQAVGEWSTVAKG